MKLKLKTIDKIKREFITSIVDDMILIETGDGDAKINCKMFSMFGKQWDVEECTNGVYCYKIWDINSERGWYFCKDWFESPEFFKWEEFII